MAVELVTSMGEPLGSATVRDAHVPPGRLHRAFSVVLFDLDGRTLLQRRAASKSRFGGLWSNTCCSHPAPGSTLIDFAVQRMGEELRLPPMDLAEVGRFSYRAADEVGGWVEHEYDHVLVGTIPATDPDPDPSEVDAWRWVSTDELHTELAQDPASFTPWFGQALTLAVSSPLQK
jgi:isopentenyl-diphosphate delta-isomerase